MPEICIQTAVQIILICFLIIGYDIVIRAINVQKSCSKNKI